MATLTSSDATNVNSMTGDTTETYEGSLNEAETKKTGEAGGVLCKHFLRGRCHFGDRCRMSHSVPPSDPIELPVDELEILERAEKEQKNRKSRKKLEKKEKIKISESNDPGKKPRMRTADEVINRIRWDETVNSSEFVVGHIDRFLGVLERPFDDFSWDTSVTDCDYSEELALPLHRIQYFSYQGQRVWDREQRIDRVFGSTGQTVMPPFGGETQQQENKKNSANSNLELEEHQQHPKASTLEKDEILCSCPTETEMDYQDERRTVGYSLLGAMPNCSPQGDLEHNTGACGETGTNRFGSESEATAEHSGVKSMQKLPIDVKKKNEDDGDEEDAEREQLDWDRSQPSCPLTEGVSACVSAAPQEQRTQRGKSRPTHFISFRVDSPAALHAFQRLQTKVLAHLPQSEPYWTPAPQLHVTLSLLVLRGPAEIYAASELFRIIVKELHKPPVSVQFTPKLKHFAGKVLHLVPQPLSDIQALNAPFQEGFRNKGFLHRASRSPNYHMTLAKVDGDDRPFQDVGVIRLSKDINFGKLEVKKLYLCTCNSPKTADGFYDTVCTVTVPDI